MMLGSNKSQPPQRGGGHAGMHGDSWDRESPGKQWPHKTLSCSINLSHRGSLAVGCDARASVPACHGRAHFVPAMEGHGLNFLDMALNPAWKSALVCASASATTRPELPVEFRGARPRLRSFLSALESLRGEELYPGFASEAARDAQTGYHTSKRPQL